MPKTKPTTNQDAKQALTHFQYWCRMLQQHSQSRTQLEWFVWFFCTLWVTVIWEWLAHKINFVDV